MLVNREVDWTLLHEDNQVVAISTHPGNFASPPVRYGLLSGAIFVESKNVVVCRT